MADPTPVPGLRHAAWFGAPGAAVPLLAGLDPGRQPAEVRWLAGVCLGALGRYGSAARWLDLPGDSPAAACRASHLRQLGRHAEAEPLDRLALAAAADPGARADALIGLVADAVGTGSATAARDRLDAATAAVTDSDAGWRPATRLEWVTAEVALFCHDPDTAVRAGRIAVRLSQEATARRHAVKSRLVLAAGLHASGRYAAAARVLRAAAVGADHLGLAPLAVPVRTLRAEILQVRAPRTAERERRKADSAQSIISEPTDSRTYR